MPTADVRAVRAAYDAIALEYDARVAASAWVRERLWQRLDVLFPSGSRVLDATAGTGLDAAHLVARGVRVTACDLSPGMLARLAVRLPGVPTVAADLNRIGELRELAGLGGAFDGVISTFAGVNAVADLAGFACGAARLLRPGGMLFLHALNRWPVADLFRRLRAGGPGGLGRALRASLRGEKRVTIEGIPVPHRLWTPRRLTRAFAPELALLAVRGSAVLRPADGEGGGRLEGLLERLPLCRAAGTFFTLELVRR
jgi:SAM-dependent methyltransferase